MILTLSYFYFYPVFQSKSTNKHVLREVVNRWNFVYKTIKNVVHLEIYYIHRNKLFAFDDAFSIVAWYSAQT